MTQTARFDPENKVKVCFDFKMFDVKLGASIDRKDGPKRVAFTETFSVVPQRTGNCLLAGQCPSMVRSHFNSPELVAKSLRHT